MKIKVNLKENSYEVLIDESFDFSTYKNITVLSNEKLFSLYEKELKKIIKTDFSHILIPDGEGEKNINRVEKVLDELFELRLDRKSLLISFGGGVLSDLTGFIASIYMRGIDFINMPTSLLACVDAAVGGKTGINNKYGKNLIGSFYQPKAVLIHTDFLKSLDERELLSAVSEIIKMAVFFDEDLFLKLEKSEIKDAKSFVLENAELLISRSVKMKARVVELDEKESSLRMSLNYGHTFAHVIEQESGYGHYLHGEAVAFGMVMANNLACNIGLLNKDLALRVKALLEKFNFKTSYKINDAKSFYDAFFLDKKSKKGKLNFVLLKGLKEFVIKDDISEDEIMEILR